mgnify:CR=1 FL=1
MFCTIVQTGYNLKESSRLSLKIGYINLHGIGWEIVEGESGPGAREMKEEWVIDIREQCIRSGVPFFFKQWGGVRKKAAERVLEGRTWDEMPRVINKNKCARSR